MTFSSGLFRLFSVLTIFYFSGALGVVGEVKEILGGGDPVVINDFPWLVGLLDISLGDEVRKLVCGGSILSPSHVLTSGRCVTRWLPQNGTHQLIAPSTLRLIAGDISRMEDEEEEQFRPVLHIILHPEFKYDPGYKGLNNEEGKKPEKGFTNDLAILVVDPPFNMSAGGVGPIALGGSHFYSMLTSSDAEDLTIAGWGITDKRQNTIPTGISLKKVTLPFTSSKLFLYKDGKHQKSSSIFGLWLDLSTAGPPSLVQFSSGLGSDRGLMGRCMGDTGSAVVVKEPEIRPPILVGIVSFGIWCDRYIPSGQLYLLTPPQLDWVEEIINPKFWAFLSLGVIGILGLLSAAGVLLVRRKRGGLRSWRL